MNSERKPIQRESEAVKPVVGKMVEKGKRTVDAERVRRVADEMEAMLEEEERGSFPASDPPSHTGGHS